MRRSLTQYANCTPEAVASGSKAQMMYFVEDAKADIARMAEDLKAVRTWVLHWDEDRKCKLPPTEDSINLVLAHIDMSLAHYGKGS